MNAPPYHLFVVQNDDFDKLQSGYNLPFSDESYFVSGFLVNKRLNDEELEQVRIQSSYLAGRKSLYYFGQTILEDHDPKINEPFSLVDEGYLIVTLSGPGYNNTDNHSKFEGELEKYAIKDNLTIRSDFTWERSKEIDAGFYLKWNGTYSYSGDLLVFSLSEQGYSGLYFSNINDTNIKHYGLMYGPIIDNHKINEPMEGLISGLVSEDVSGMITGVISGAATGVVTGTGSEIVYGELEGTFTNFITQEIYDEANGIATGEVYGEIVETEEAIGKGIAENTKTSGMATGNVHAILSNNTVIAGVGLAENILAATSPTNFPLSGVVECTVDDVLISGLVNKPVDNILISGMAYGVANDISVTCMGNGTANNVQLAGTINGTINGTMLSGLIKEAVNNVLISGWGSGMAYNVPVSGSATKTINNVEINGLISDTIKNIQISGLIKGYVDNVSVMGKVEGVLNGVLISGLVHGITINSVFSDYISGTVYGQINVKPSDLIDDGFVSGSMVNTFKANLYNSIYGSIGTNEEKFFGSTADEIRKMISGAIEDVVDNNSLYNIITPIYLSKSSIVDLTDKILLDAIIANGNYISGAAYLNGKINIDGEISANSISGSITGKASVSGSASINGTITGGTVATNAGTGSLNDDAVTVDAGTGTVNDKSVAVNAGTGSVTGGTTSIAGGNGSITDGGLDATIESGSIGGKVEIEGRAEVEADVSIKGANINPLRTKTYTEIRNAIIDILSNIQINKLVYGIVDSYEISDTISGEVSGLLVGIVSDDVTGYAPGYVSGYATGTIKGTVENDVICSISKEISVKVSDSVSVMGYGTASIVVYAPGVGDVVIQKRVLNTFLDDSFSDFTNFYKISGTNEIANSVNVVNPGGRGQLSKYFILNTDDQNNLFYDVGSYNDITTKLQMDGLPLLEATVGNQTEFPPYTNYFGGIGGNIIQNSLDFYEKSIPENGFVRIMYTGPGFALTNFRTLEISMSGLEVLPDETAGTINGNIINKMPVQNEADVYYRILDRTKELDLDESALNGIPLSKYAVKYEVPDEYAISGNISYNKLEQIIKRKYANSGLYITELDNHRRKMSFLTPFKSDDKDNPKNIKLDLKTTDRKFYFAIARDNNIDTVKIGGFPFHPEDQDKDGLYRRYKKRDNNGNVILNNEGNPTYLNYEFFAGQPYDIRITFKDEKSALMKDLIVNYLSDCLVNSSISRSNNYVQTIDSFEMPARDVLLFLKTEKSYILTINKNEQSHGISEIFHEGETKLPIVKNHFWDDKIEIEVMFTDRFSEIDREDLKNQLPDIDEIKYNYSERPYLFNKDDRPFEETGYDISVPQIIKFLMPARDVTLFLKEKDYRHTLTIRAFNKKTDDNDPDNDNEPNHFSRIDLNNEPQSDNLYGPNSNRLGASLELKYQFRKGEDVKIEVFFSGDKNQYYELDNEFITTQLMAFKRLNGKNEYVERRLRNGPENTFDGPSQKINFEMPDQDVVLVVKEITIMRKLTVKLDPYQEALVAKKIQGVVYDNSLEDLPVELEMVEGNEINLYVKFEDDRMKLDESHFYGQTIPERIYEAGELDPKPGIINDNDKELYQRARFKMPDSNFTLYLRWTERVYTITVDHPISIMSSAKYSIDRGGATIEGYFYNELRCYTKDKVTIDFELYEGFILDYTKSKYTIGNENGYLTQSQIKYPSNNDVYFEKTENKNNISIEATIRKKDITIVLKEKFSGIKKLICPGLNSLSTGEIQLLKQPRPAKVILWGANGNKGGKG